MPISPQTPNYDNSPWYDIMEQKAQAWNAMANRLELPIEGDYNAHQIHFNLTLTHPAGPIYIQGNRQLTTVTSGLTPARGRFQEEMLIKQRSVIKDANFFLKAYRNHWFNNILHLGYKTRFTDQINGLVVKYEDPELIHNLAVDVMLHSEGLFSMNINRKGLQIKLLKVPADMHTLDHILNLIRFIH